MRLEWLIIAIFLPLLAMLGSGKKAPPAATQPAREKVVIAGETFKLELALDEPSRNKGLMHRTSIDADGGMLFVYPKPQKLEFWMKNCVIDMDLIFLDAQGRIVALHPMKAEKPRGSHESEDAYESRLKLYASRKPAQFAIELRAGTIERLDFRIGVCIGLDIQRIRTLAK